MDKQTRIRIGRRIAELRAKRGISQRKLARLSGVHNTYIARAELGKENPSLKILTEILAPLGAYVDVIEDL